ncbi:MAG TPA: ROK family transcriptional regulator [Trebonia sp.]|nr:ROK family transcriptional regulator [Trebonia sp.]
MQPRVRTGRPAPRSSRDLVLTALRALGPLSRAELVRATGAAPSTVSGVVGELTAAGLVVGSSSERDPAQPGRPGLRLTLNPRLGTVAGVEFGFASLRVLLCDVAHNVIGSAACELPAEHASAVALDAARALTDQALGAAGLPRAALLGAGVSLPGPVGRHPDVVKSSAILPGWRGVSGPDIAAALGVPVSIDNDSNLAALGEHAWGAGRGCDDSVTLKFHTGIGCGLFANGTLVRGTSGGAGEIGHVTVDERGPLCRCGKRGCLETYAAVPAILEALRPRHGPLTAPGLMRLLSAGDPGAVRVAGDAAGLIGTHLAATCNLLAPQRIIVIGLMAGAGPVVLDPIRAAIRRHVAPNEAPEVVAGSLGDQHTALGAIALALDETDWLPAAAGGTRSRPARRAQA